MPRTVVTPLDQSTVVDLVSRVGRRGIKAVAVCLLHSYRNPSHERAVAEIDRKLPRAVTMAASPTGPLLNREEAPTAADATSG